MPEGSRMTPMRVKLYYREQPFASIDLEILPDLSGCAEAAEERMDSGLKMMLSDLGFQHIAKPRVMNATSQVAEKLHAISRPGRIRGRDLADIAVIAEHEAIDYEELRQVARRIENVQGQHLIHMLVEDERESYRESFEYTDTRKTFDECWTITQRLLEQVDERQKDKWLL